MEPTLGFEPKTSSLPRKCSAAELCGPGGHDRIEGVVGREGIEPPQSKTADLQSAELTTCSTYPRTALTLRDAMPRGEEMTCAVSSSVGADDGTRTRNRRFTKPLLYQLSYVGGDVEGYRTHAEACNGVRWTSSAVGPRQCRSVAGFGLGRAAPGASGGKRRGASGLTPAPSAADASRSRPVRRQLGLDAVDRSGQARPAAARRRGLGAAAALVVGLTRPARWRAGRPRGFIGPQASWRSPAWHAAFDWLRPAVRRVRAAAALLGRHSVGAGRVTSTLGRRLPGRTAGSLGGRLEQQHRPPPPR